MIQKQINNGFKEYYYLQEDGTIYNADSDKIVKSDTNHSFTLRTINNSQRKLSLKTLYKLVYNKNFCIDRIQDLEGEEWKEIEDTNGLYYISNKGRVKSYHGYRALILSGYSNKCGYLRVDIKVENKRQSKLIHRLVAAAFLPLPENIDLQLHHKDLNKTNNAADNLQWLSAAEHSKIHRKGEKKIVSA